MHRAKDRANAKCTGGDVIKVLNWEEHFEFRWVGKSGSYTFVKQHWWDQYNRHPICCYATSRWQVSQEKKAVETNSKDGKYPGTNNTTRIINKTFWNSWRKQSSVLALKKEADKWLTFSIIRKISDLDPHVRLQAAGILPKTLARLIWSIISAFKGKWI